MRNKKGQFLKKHKQLNTGRTWFKKGNTRGHRWKKGERISPKTEFKKGQISWNKGKKNPTGSLAKMGDKNPMWKGGIYTPKKYEEFRKCLEFRLWRNSVLEKNSRTCQKCGTKKELQTHHIQNFFSYWKLRFAIDNGITLCKKCHRKFHLKYGTRKNNKKQLCEFLERSKQIL